MKSGKISPFLWVALGVSVGLFGFFLILANPFGWKMVLPTFIPQSNSPQSATNDIGQAPTPYLFLPHGKQTYNARGGSNKASVASITYDPLDPAINSSQTITVTVESTEPVKSVDITVNTDKQTTVHSLSLTSGTTTDGVWTTTFTVTDTYAKIYNVSFAIITELGNKITQPMLLR
jgi:hypothetical protein